MILIPIIIGLLLIFFPEFLFEIKMSFYTNDNPEPDKLVIILMRISGIILIIYFSVKIYNYFTAL